MLEQQLRRELDAVYASLSWRITWPLRRLSALLGFSTPVPVDQAVKMPSVEPQIIEEIAVEETSYHQACCETQLESIPVDPLTSVIADLSPQEKRIFSELHSLLEKNSYAHSH